MASTATAPEPSTGKTAETQTLSGFTLPELPKWNDTTKLLLQWLVYDKAADDWLPVEKSAQLAWPKDEPQGDANKTKTKLSMYTWNVDAFGAGKKDRMQALLKAVLDADVDIVFLQEVSPTAHQILFDHPAVRERYYVSNTDVDDSLGVRDVYRPFSQETLVSRRRSGSSLFQLGPLFRIDFPSRYARYALCCDLTVRGWPEDRNVLRLANVHLDSLASTPNRRVRQLAVVAEMLGATGTDATPTNGLVAGDFNPVQDEDETLVQENHLVDAWTQLYPDDPGETWNIDGRDRKFAKQRMDKVATTSQLRVDQMTIAHPQQAWSEDEEEAVPWSDHSGLSFSFTLVD